MPSFDFMPTVSLVVKHEDGRKDELNSQLTFCYDLNDAYVASGAESVRAFSALLAAACNKSGLFVNKKAPTAFNSMTARAVRITNVLGHGGNQKKLDRYVTHCKTTGADITISGLDTFMATGGKKKAPTAASARMVKDIEKMDDAVALQAIISAAMLRLAIVNSK